MTTVYLSPVFNGWQGFDSSGQVLTGGQLFTYQAGTTTPEATYTTNSGSIANTNPIVLGSDGRPTSEIWLAAGQAYKFILEDSLGNQIGSTLDNVYGVNDPVLDPVVAAATEWVLYSGTPTFISGASFSVPGNAIATFQILRRVQATISTGTLVWGTVATATYANSITTVTLTMDGLSLDSGLSAVSTGILGSLHPSYPAIIGTAPYVIAAGTGDAFTATLASSFYPLNVDDFQIEVKAVAANTTGAPTFDLTLGASNTGAQKIVKYNNAPLVAGDISGAGVVLQLRWSTTYGAWILLNPAFGQVYPWSASNQVIIFTASGTQVVPAGFAFKATVQGGGSGSSQNPGAGGASSIVFNGVTVTANGGVLGANASASGGDLNISGTQGSASAGNGTYAGACVTPTGYGYGGPTNQNAVNQFAGSSGATSIKWFPPASTQLTATITVGAAGGNGTAGIVILEY